MPHHKSAEKRVRTNEKSRERNAAIRSRLRHALTRQRSVATIDDSRTGLPGTLAEVDTARRKGIIPAGRADRLKSRLARAVNRLASAPVPEAVVKKAPRARKKTAAKS